MWQYAAVCYFSFFSAKVPPSTCTYPDRNDLGEAGGPVMDYIVFAALA